MKFKIVVATAALMLFAPLCMAGLFGTDYVGSLKDSVMEGYNTTTIGKAFEGTFDNPQWSTFETDKGVRVVQFKGVISQKTHDTVVRVTKASYRYEQLLGAAVAIGEERWIKSGAFRSKKELDGSADKDLIDFYLERFVWPVGGEVTAQWTISHDGKTFEIDGLYSDWWEGVPAETILEFIYS